MRYLEVKWRRIIKINCPQIIGRAEFILILCIQSIFAQDTRFHDSESILHVYQYRDLPLQGRAGYKGEKT